MTVYTGYFTGGKRLGVVQRFCAECAVEYVQQVVAVAAPAGDGDYVELPEACAACHSAINGDAQPMYVTAYPPKQERRDLLIMLCEACEMNIRPTLTAGGEPTADRYGGPSGEGAPSPLPSEAAFKALPW
jgi:hypothetical protein